MQRTKNKRPRDRLQANRLFFPAAAVHAALILPLSILVMTTAVTWPAGLRAGHGYEMLFGFALALVVGYLLGPQPKARLYILFGLWLAARLGRTSMADSIIPVLLELLFVLAAAWHIVPRLLAAKKWRNRIIAPLVLCLFLLPVIYTYFSHEAFAAAGALFPVAVILFTLLMTFMGGRILSAAAAGEFYRQGNNLEARVQPRLEGALIVLLIAAAVVFPFPAGPVLTGLMLLASGALVAARLYRWQLWRCRRKPDLIALGIGYAWLAIGMLFMGIALIADLPLGAAMHVITIGALGTLSISIIARIHFLSLKRPLTDTSLFVSATTLIAAATILRLLPQLTDWNALVFIWAAALSWSFAYLLLAVQLLNRTKGNP